MCVILIFYFDRILNLNFIGENLFHHQMSSRGWRMSQEEAQHTQPYRFR
jgi:hypothetical protein